MELFRVGWVCTVCDDRYRRGHINTLWVGIQPHLVGDICVLLCDETANIKVIITHQ